LQHFMIEEWDDIPQSTLIGIGLGTSLCHNNTLYLLSKMTQNWS